MSVRTRRPPAWWVVVLVLLLALWVGVTFLYRRGASGVSFSGGASGAGGGVSFDRQNDIALFEIDERVALVVTGDGSEAVVKYGRGAFPFCPLCGTYELRGSVVNLARYYQNGWIYTDHPGGPFAELYHVASGRALDVARPAGDSVDVRTLPDFSTRGLTFEPAYRLTPALIHELFQPIAVINESCVVFNAAFLLLTAAWLIVALAIAIRGRRIG